MVIDSLNLAKKISKAGKKLEITVKDILCPIILGCHDEEGSEKGMKELKEKCRALGYTNALRLNEIPDEKGKPMEYNIKFKLLILKTLLL